MQQRKLKTIFAFLPVIILLTLVLSDLFLDQVVIDIRFTLIIATISAVIIGVKNGFKLDDLIAATGKLFSKAFPIVLILICIGGIVGTWMYSGTVPFLIYYGMKFLHPDYIPVTAFMVTALISTFTGTSWGSAATSGVAFMGIAQTMDVSEALVAGAAISGAVFGDKISPISDTTNICALSAEVSVYQHIRSMLPNVILAGFISALLFLIMGSHAGSQSSFESATLLSDQLAGIYNLSPIVLIPAAIIFLGAYLGYNPIALMLTSSFAAMTIGLFFQGFEFDVAMSSLFSGFDVSEVTSNLATLDPLLLTLLNRGGFEGMMSGAVLACVLAISFGSIMAEIGALDIIVSYILKPVRSTFGLVNSAFVTGGVLNGLTGNAMFSIITVGQIFTSKFEQNKLPRTLLSRSMENSMTLLESLIPWHVTAIFMSATLGVSTIDYLPYAFFNWIGIGLFFFFAFTTIRKINQSD